MQWASLLGSVVCVASIGAAACGPTAAPTFLKASATLSFHRGESRAVFAEFDLRFRSPAHEVICIPEGMLPGSDGFDPALIRFRGPQGDLATEAPVESTEPAAVAKFAMRFMVFRRNTDVSLGVRIGKSHYLFDAPGRYVAELRIPVYDCSKLPLVNGYDDNRPGWLLGDLVASAPAVLR